MRFRNMPLIEKERKEREERRKFLEACYTHFLATNKALRIEGYVNETVDRYYEFRDRIKINMENPKNLIDFHKILAGTVLAILWVYNVKPDTGKYIDDWEENPDVLHINVAFAIQTIAYFFGARKIEGASYHENRFINFTKKYEKACKGLTLLLRQIAKTMRKEEYTVDLNYVFLLSYKFFLLDELMGTFETENNTV